MIGIQFWNGWSQVIKFGTQFIVGLSVGFGDKLPRNWRGDIRVTATLVSFDHHTIRRQPRDSAVTESRDNQTIPELQNCSEN